MRPILLDTCALVWVAGNVLLRPEAELALAEAEDVEGAIVASPISALELAEWVAERRIGLSMDAAAWFRIIQDCGVAIAPMPPEVLIASAFLPGAPPPDPVDRILAATARAYSYRLMTRDRTLLDFAAEGHLQAIAC